MQHQNIWTQNRVLKITIIHQYKIELQERIKNQEKENNHFSRENVRENNKKFIENNMGIKIVYIYSSKHQIIQVIQVMLYNKITLYSYILSL